MGIVSPFSVPDSSFWAGRRVLLTGHTGFKGSWLALWLLKLGAQVTGLALSPDTEPNLFAQLGLERRLDHRVGDIRDAEKVASLVNCVNCWFQENPCAFGAHPSLLPPAIVRCRASPRSRRCMGFGSACPWRSRSSAPPAPTAQLDRAWLLHRLAVHEPAPQKTHHQGDQCPHQRQRRAVQVMPQQGHAGESGECERQGRHPIARQTHPATTAGSSRQIRSSTSRLPSRLPLSAIIKLNSRSIFPAIVSCSLAWARRQRRCSSSRFRTSLNALVTKPKTIVSGIGLVATAFVSTQTE